MKGLFVKYFAHIFLYNILDNGEWNLSHRKRLRTELQRPLKCLLTVDQILTIHNIYHKLFHLKM
jgi:hypothetical protein